MQAGRATLVVIVPRFMQTLRFQANVREKVEKPIFIVNFLGII